MELRALLKTILRWSWLIVLVVVVTLAVLLLRQQMIGPRYEATVKVRPPTRTQEDTAGFRELLHGSAVQRQTAKELDLQGEAAEYDVDVQSVLGTGFIYVTIGASSPSLAAEIANTHTNVAINAFEDLRYGPTETQRLLLEEKLRTAEEEVLDAEQAQADFQAEHGIASMEQKLQQHERTLALLETDRDQRVMDQDEGAEIAASLEEIEQMIAENRKEGERLAALVAPYHVLEEQAKAKRAALERLLNQAERSSSAGLTQEISEAEEEMRAADDALAEFHIENGFTSLSKELSAQQRLREQFLVKRDNLLMQQASLPDSSVSEVDELIALRQQKLEKLAELQATYYLLRHKADEARAHYSGVRTQLTRIEILVKVEETADPILVVEQAQGSSKPTPDPKRLLVIGLVTSLSLGILLAFALESIFPSKKAGTPSSTPEQGAPASPGLEDAHDVASWSEPTEAKTP